MGHSVRWVRASGRRWATAVVGALAALAGVATPAWAGGGGGLVFLAPEAQPQLVGQPIVLEAIVSNSLGSVPAAQVQFQASLTPSSGFVPLACASGFPPPSHNVFACEATLQQAGTWYLRAAYVPVSGTPAYSPVQSLQVQLVGAQAGRPETSSTQLTVVSPPTLQAGPSLQAQVSQPPGQAGTFSGYVQLLYSLSADMQDAAPVPCTNFTNAQLPVNSSGQTPVCTTPALGPGVTVWLQARFVPQPYVTNAMGASNSPVASVASPLSSTSTQVPTQLQLQCSTPLLAGQTLQCLAQVGYNAPPGGGLGVILAGPFMGAADPPVTQGSVTFSIGGHQLAQVPLNSSGQAALQVPGVGEPGSPVPEGTSSIEATWGPGPISPTLEGEESSATTQVDVQVPHTTSTSVTCAPDPVQMGQSVTCRALVQTVENGKPAALGTGTGSVQFQAPGGLALGAPVPLSSSGQAQVSIPAGSKSLPVGTDQIQALFQPSSYLYGASSGSASLTVTAAVPPPTSLTPTSTTVTCTPQPQTAGDPVTCVAQVRVRSGAPPQGSVQFTGVNGLTLGPPVPLDPATGVAERRVQAGTDPLPVGRDQVVAKFMPALGTDLASSTGAFKQVVNPRGALPVQLRVSCTPASVQLGDSAECQVQLRFTLRGTAPVTLGQVHLRLQAPNGAIKRLGAPTPSSSGSVGPLSTGPLDQLGTWKLLANWGPGLVNHEYGDVEGAFASGSASIVVQAPPPPPPPPPAPPVTTLVVGTQTQVSCSPDPATSGQMVTCTAQVRADDNQVPPGSVTFSDARLGSVPLNTLGQAQIQVQAGGTGPLSVGANQVVATYVPPSGSIFVASSGSTVEQVQSPPSSTPPPTPAPPAPAPPTPAHPVPPTPVSVPPAPAPRPSSTAPQQVRLVTGPPRAPAGTDWLEWLGGSLALVGASVLAGVATRARRARRGGARA
jgi:hypothetical protein